MQELRAWAGESLWEGKPAGRRVVELAPIDGGRFKATGQAGAAPAFQVSLRPEQLRRFRLEMGRSDAHVHGLPLWAEGGSSGDPPPRPPRGPRGPIGTDGSEEPPPTQPKALLPDSNPMLLLADANGRRPLLPPSSLGRDALARVPELEERLARPEFLGDPGGNPNDLKRQRWGVIAPHGKLGDELLEAIRPLIDLRAAQQGAEVHHFRAPSAGGTTAANAWIRQIYRSETIPEHERPGYLLLLGDLPEVPAELQLQLGASTHVGRLCFDDPTGYRAYADKVVRHEQAPPTQSARALLFTTHDGSDATREGYEALVLPALELCDAVPKRDYPVREILEVGAPDDWSMARLLEAARADGPSVLFTLSHGVGLPRSHFSSEERRARQGAMAFGSGDPLTASHVASGPFLPGGAWFFLACLSAGTPSRSVYKPWLQQLQAHGASATDLEAVLSVLPGDGEVPFIAALPRAALANPEGPLAVIGHLDLAWTFSFLDAYGARRPARFVEVVKQLWTGRRAGVASKALLRHASDVEADLLGLAQEDAERGRTGPTSAKAVQRGNLWMARHDLVGYMLLGDPAVRIGPPKD